MRFFQFRLPSVLALVLISYPLVSRADQTPTDQHNAVPTASIHYDTINQAQQLVEVTNSDVLVNEQQVDQMEPIQIDPTPIDIIGIDQPIGSPDPTPSAITPEPSSMALLATGLLLGGIVWMRERS